MQKYLLLLFLFISFSNAHSQENLFQDFDLGEYNVGFRNEIITDYSRSFGDDFRPIQMFIWYPIDENQRSPMKYIDYYLLPDLKDQQRDTIEKIHYGLLDSMLSAEIKDLKISGNNEDILARYKNLITISQKDAQISVNSFPLILFAPGGNTSAYIHSVICEFLASYGYIVVSIPSLGNSEGKRWPFDNIGLNIQIDDMSFAINHLANTMKEFNTEKICLISWSVGGVSQGIYCMKNSLIDMFISLDSGLGREYGVEMIKVSPYFDYSKIKIPFLHIQRVL